MMKKLMKRGIPVNPRKLQADMLLNMMPPEK